MKGQTKDKSGFVTKFVLILVTINKKTFYNNKKQFGMQQIDTNKILISEPEPYGKKNAIKYIIEYNDNAIRPLRILLPKMIGYIKYFHDNKKTMSLLFLMQNY